MRLNSSVDIWKVALTPRPLFHAGRGEVEAPFPHALALLRSRRKGGKAGRAEKNPHPRPFPREQGKGGWLMKRSRWDCLSLFIERVMSEKSHKGNESTETPSLLAGRGLGVGSAWPAVR